MSLDDLERPLCALLHYRHVFTKIWMNCTLPILSAAKCSPGILVTRKIKFMRIAYWRGFAGEGVSNESGDVKNGEFCFFRSLYLPNIHIQCHNYYITICSPLMAFHWSCFIVRTSLSVGPESKTYSMILVVVVARPLGWAVPRCLVCVYDCYCDTTQRKVIPGRSRRR